MSICAKIWRRVPKICTKICAQKIVRKSANNNLRKKIPARQNQSKNRTKNQWENVASLEEWKPEKKNTKSLRQIGAKPQTQLINIDSCTLVACHGLQPRNVQPPKFPSLSCDAVPHFKPFAFWKFCWNAGCRPSNGTSRGWVPGATVKLFLVQNRAKKLWKIWIFMAWCRFCVCTWIFDHFWAEIRKLNHFARERVTQNFHEHKSRHAPDTRPTRPGHPQHAPDTLWAFLLGFGFFCFICLVSGVFCNFWILFLLFFTQQLFFHAVSIVFLHR